ncbi:MAG: hypothetical protein ABIK31_02755 [candidate division WOR-3 bacterium]
MKYTFNKNVNPSVLTLEIQNSEITKALSHIDTIGDVVDIWFKDVLSDVEENILHEILLNHVPSVENSEALSVVIEEDKATLRDLHTKKLITKDEPFNGPLYISCIRFRTGLDSLDSSWKPPVTNPSHWSIDVSQPGLTIVKYSPDFNYQIDGCGFKSLDYSVPSGELVFRKIAIASGTPYEHSFIENYQITKIAEQYERITSPKFIKYYPQNPNLNTIFFEIEHFPEVNFSLQIWVSTYIIK